MEWLIRETGIDEKLFSRTAGIKARDDLDAILIGQGVQPAVVFAPQNIRNDSNKLKKLTLHKEVEKCWFRDLEKLKRGDTLYMQFPVVNHTIYLSNVVKNLKNRGVKVYAFIHDLEYFRHAVNHTRTWAQRWRLSKEETSVLVLFDGVVVHNDIMKKAVNEKLGVPMEKMVSLGIFDYLIPRMDEAVLKRRRDGFDKKSCIVAGNLKKSKALYLYDLPNNCKFDLYGPNYQAETIPENVNYHGSFDPDDLPNALEGMFGLVWDGSSPKTCEGAWGEYLKINNPHKTSLYLASGIPVVIWSKAAMADFVKRNYCGIVVDSLEELHEKIEQISLSEYMNMVTAANRLSEKLRQGKNTLDAINELKKL